MGPAPATSAGIKTVEKPRQTPFDSLPELGMIYGFPQVGGSGLLGRDLEAG